MDIRTLVRKQLVLVETTAFVSLHAPSRVEEGSTSFDEREEPYDTSYRCSWCGKEIAKDEETIEKMIKEGKIKPLKYLKKQSRR